MDCDTNPLGTEYKINFSRGKNMNVNKFRKIGLAVATSLFVSFGASAALVTQNFSAIENTDFGSIGTFVDIRGETNLGAFFIRVDISDPQSSQVQNFFDANSALTGSFSYNTDAPLRPGFSSSYVAESVSVSVVNPITNETIMTESNLPTISTRTYGEVNDFGFSTFSVGSNNFSLNSESDNVNIGFSNLNTGDDSLDMDAPSDNFTQFFTGDNSVFSGLSSETLALADAFNIATPTQYTDLDFFGSVTVENDLSDISSLPSELVQTTISNFSVLSSLIILGTNCDSNCGRIENGAEFIDFNLIEFATSGAFDVTLGDSPPPPANDAQTIFTNFVNSGELPEVETPGVFELPDFSASDSSVRNLIRLGNGEESEELVSELTIFDSFFFVNTPVVADTPIVFDPIVATAYDFQVSGQQEQNFFASVTFPQIGNDSAFALYVYDEFGDKSFLANIDAGVLFTLPDFTSHFEVAGINPDLELDPNDPFAFPVLLTFTNTGLVDVMMTPIGFDNTVIAPEPPTAVNAPPLSALFGLSIFGMLLVSRKRNR